MLRVQTFFKKILIIIKLQPRTKPVISSCQQLSDYDVPDIAVSLPLLTFSKSIELSSLIAPCSFLCLCVCLFLGPPLRHMEVPRLGVELEL